jgi:NAD(P)-dependent dehydrogenase (short-subunit alcohol dehydrogenase family)
MVKKEIMMNKAFRFKNKDIWVIGGAGYLGQAIVKLLLKSGARVLCADLDKKAFDFEKSLNHEGKFIPVSLDARDQGAVNSFINDSISKYGIPEGLVILTYGSTSKKLDDLSEKDFDDANHAGLTSTFLMCRAVAKEMENKDRGSIILFSSMYGMVSPDPDIYISPMNPNPLEYGVGKAGIIQMTRYLAVHYAKKGIRFNCISPGPFPNPVVQNDHPVFINSLAKKVPMGRVGRSGEISGAVAFLLSDYASFITGHNLVVDGGWTCW